MSDRILDVGVAGAIEGQGLLTQLHKNTDENAFNKSSNKIAAFIWPSNDD